MELKGIGTIVTGASRGFGLALAQELAAAGARVLMVARGEAALERAAEQIRGWGGEAHAFPADVADKNQSHSIALAASALVGPVELLVNNASSLGPVPLELLLDTPCEEIELAFAVNVLGPFRLTKTVAGGMVLRHRGLILNVSSDAAANVYPKWGAYGLTKAALDHLTRTLAVEVEETGVIVASVDPGDMDTQMHRDALPDADPASLLRPEDVAAKLVRAIRGGSALPTRFQLSALEVAE